MVGFILALTAALIGFLVLLARDSGAVVVASSSAAGAALGAVTLMVLVRFTGDRKMANGSGLIVLAALAGTFSSHYPPWLAAALIGLVVGFFLTFVAVLLERWYRDPSSRSQPPEAAFRR